jgi:hypothetical protein
MLLIQEKTLKREIMLKTTNLILAQRIINNKNKVKHHKIYKDKTNMIIPNKRKKNKWILYNIGMKH